MLFPLDLYFEPPSPAGLPDIPAPTHSLSTPSPQQAKASAVWGPCLATTHICSDQRAWHIAHDDAFSRERRTSQWPLGPSLVRRLAHLAPGPHDPLRAGVCVAGPRAVGSQRLFAEAWLWAGHQTLLLATTTSLGALEERDGQRKGSGYCWGLKTAPHLVPGPPGLTSLQEEMYQLRQGCTPQGRRVGGMGGPGWQWKGRSGRRSCVSTHCTSRTEEPPPQPREHCRAKSAV